MTFCLWQYFLLQLCQIGRRELCIKMLCFIVTAQGHRCRENAVKPFATKVVLRQTNTSTSWHLLPPLGTSWNQLLPVNFWPSFGTSWISKLPLIPLTTPFHVLTPLVTCKYPLPPLGTRYYLLVPLDTSCQPLPLLLCPC